MKLIDVVEKYISVCDFDDKDLWTILSRNANITFEDVMSHPDYPWNWVALSWNPNIVMKNVLGALCKGWCWFALSSHMNIIFENIMDWRELPWEMSHVVQNPNVTLRNILGNYMILGIKDLFKPTHEDEDDGVFPLFVENRNLAIADVFANHELNWCWRWISKYAKLSILDVLENPNAEWDFYMLTLNENISEQDMLVNPQFKWCSKLASFVREQQKIDLDCVG